MPATRSGGMPAGACAICEKLDEEAVIQCAKCGSVFHPPCLLLDPEGVDDTWQCRGCINVENPFGRSRRVARSPSRGIQDCLNSVTEKASETSGSETPQYQDAEHRDDEQLTLDPEGGGEVNVASAEMIEMLETAQAETKRLAAENEKWKNALNEQVAKAAAETEALASRYEEEASSNARELEKLKEQVEHLRIQADKSNQPEESSHREIINATKPSSATLEAPSNQNPPKPAINDLQQRILNAKKSHAEILRTSEPTSSVPAKQNADDLAAIVLLKLTETIPALIRDVITPPVQPELPAPVYDAAVQKQEETVVNEKNAFDKLAVTMQRKYLRKLPNFSGEEREWPAFVTVYEATSQEGNYSEADNVARLREALKPPALNLVIDLLKFSTNASAIISELREAYGRPERLVVKLTDELMAQLPVQSQTDIKLRDFALLAKNYVASLKAMERDSDLKNEYVLEHLVEKLHFSHYKEWSQLKKEDPNANLEKFADFLMDKVKEIPAAMFSKSTIRPTSAGGNSKTKRVNHHQASVEPTAESKACQLCRKPHALPKCKEFLNKSVRERNQFVYGNRLCTSCLESDTHGWADCPAKRQCGLSGCQKFHHRLLHNDYGRRDGHCGNKGGFKPNPTAGAGGSNGLSANAKTFAPSQRIGSDSRPCTNSGNSGSASSGQTQASEVLVDMRHITSDAVLFKIVRAQLSNEDGSRTLDAYAFLDDGSSMTLVEQEVLETIDVTGTPEKLCLQWTSDITREENASRCSISIAAPRGKRRFTLTNVLGVSRLGLPKQTIIAAELKRRHPHLRTLPLFDMIDAQPVILIGLKHARFLLGSDHRVSDTSNVIASKTMLGWTVYGTAAPSLKINASADREQGFQLSIREASRMDEDLQQSVSNWMTTENFGVVPLKNDLVSDEQRRAERIMKQTLRKIHGRYEIGLLWRSDNSRLPDSYQMAYNRLLSEERSLRNKDLMDWKNAHVQELVAKGYARVASEAELKRAWARVWYCPMFVTINPNKLPTKPRNVADVAATVRGVSLNSQLLKGPDNTAPLLRGLLVIREREFAVNADVKEMFPQVKIIEADQQCQRFLWRDGETDREPTIYVMESMMFGPTCSPTCAQYVKNQHAAQYKEKYPDAVEALIENTYVDDYFNSHATITAALAVSRNAIEICREMGFELVGFQSNSAELIKALPASNIKAGMVSLDGQEADAYTAKILGMYWETSSDVFTYKLVRNDMLDKMLQRDYRPTKREVLKMIARIFDPLGLIAHYLIRGKIILQEIWREGVDWDQIIPCELQEQWHEFVVQLQNIEKIKIPRWYAPVNPAECEVQLVTFVDASERAFAATAFFRFVCGDQVHVAHVMGKARVAPIKKLTIPQLELQAAVMGVRLACTIKKLSSIKPQKEFYLSDSKTTLSWVCSRKYKFGTFVAVRVGEILESTTRSQWHHIGTKENVADDGTKWSDPTMGNNDERWLRGPKFLKSPESTWPIKPGSAVPEDEETEQVTRLMIHQETEPVEQRYEVLNDIGPRFLARWESYLRVIAYLLRPRNKKGKIPVALHITPEELKQAELLVFRKIQWEAFHREVIQFEAESAVGASSKGGRKSVDKGSRLRTLSPFMSADGVIRMESRSQLAKTSYAARNPVILPSRHPLVELLVQYHHEKNFHMGEDTTIADIRETAWIIDCRNTVRHVKAKCQLCKILRVRPLTPRMGWLPPARIDFGVKPFTHVGIDAFGPYLVKFGRGTDKRYGLILTCLTYRAVHIELMKDMSTDCCLRALRKFHSRRGQSLCYYSDNGKNFVGARNILHKDLSAIQLEAGAATARKYRIEWKFQPAYSPWFGGAWERLIQSIKKCVDHLLVTNVPTDTVLEDALIEAELYMNRRPLTHIPIDSEDAEPLTPNLALFGPRDVDKVLAPGKFEGDAVSSRAYRRVQHLANVYLSRWVREYLPIICRREKWNEKTKPLEIGDIVIVVEPNEPRDAWKKGRVTRVYPGPDGVIRTADVMLADQTMKERRSVGRLAVLDVKKEESSAAPSESELQTGAGMSSSDKTSNTEN